MLCVVVVVVVVAAAVRSKRFPFSLVISRPHPRHTIGALAVPNLQTRPPVLKYRPTRPDQITCAKIARGEIASYRPTRPGHARTPV